MHIPTHLQDLVARLGLRSFVNSKLPLDTYCESIDLFKQTLRAHARQDDDDEMEMLAEGGPRDENVVSMIACALDEEGLLRTHVLEAATVTIDAPDIWHRVCLAAGWVVLQAYALRVKKGEWATG